MFLKPSLIKSIAFNTLKKTARCISGGESFTAHSEQWPHQLYDDDETDGLPTKQRKKHPFKNLFPWKNLDEFVDTLERRIVFNDRKLIAIDKPWGVAYHKANKTLHKPYSFETLSQIAGEPKFCLDNALPMLEERLGVEKLKLVKSIDRYSSGVILLCGDEEAMPSIKKSLATNKSEGQTWYKFVCIAQGFPVMQGDELSEKVRIKLRDIDELADYREPVIAPAVYKRQLMDNGYLARVKMKINSVNRLNSASYLQVCTNQLRWNFVRCYVAHKTAFIVGDLRFSANVKRILGEQVLETTNSFYRNNRIEPLNKHILKALKVDSNREVPVLLHLESMTLRNYLGKDLVISCKLPEHFEFALQMLKLTPSPPKAPQQSD